MYKLTLAEYYLFQIIGDATGRWSKLIVRILSWRRIYSGRWKRAELSLLFLKSTLWKTLDARMRTDISNIRYPTHAVTSIERIYSEDNRI